jgi:hypothetical protein
MSGRRVSVVKTADFSDRDDVAMAGRHDWTGNRRVLVQRHMRPGFFVIRTVRHHQLPHTRFVERDHVIEALALRRTHKSLDERILPRCVRRRHDLLNAHRCAGGAESVERVAAIIEQIPRRFGPRQLHDQKPLRPSSVSRETSGSSSLSILARLAECS